MSRVKRRDRIPLGEGPARSALVIGTDAFFVDRSEQLTALALRHAVPAISQFREFAATGGLMSAQAALTEHVPSGRHLHRPNSQGGEAGRSAGDAVRESRANHRPQDRQDARAHRPAVAARPRRRGDRMDARLHHPSRRCSGDVAARGAGAAACDAGDRIPLNSGSPAERAPFVAAFRQGLKETGYIERPDSGDRVSFCRGPLRSSAIACVRSCASPSDRDRCDGRHGIAACGQGSDDDDPYRLPWSAATL